MRCTHQCGNSAGPVNIAASGVAPSNGRSNVFFMPKPTVPKLKRLPPKKRPRKAKAGTRGSAASETILSTLNADTLATKEAIERALKGKPSVTEVLTQSKTAKHPFASNAEKKLGVGV